MTAKLLLDDYSQALARLREVLATPAENDLDRAGCIQYFEFCFELAWKTIKVVGESQGLSGLVSPRACLSQAFYRCNGRSYIGSKRGIMAGNAGCPKPHVAYL